MPNSGHRVTKGTRHDPHLHLFLRHNCLCHFPDPFVYAVGFVGNLIVPKASDTGVQGPIGPSIAVNLLLLSLFALQHSIMARPAFKRVWTKLIPKAVERSTYVLMTCVALIMIFVFWQPMTTEIWALDGAMSGTLLNALFWAGWFIVLASPL